MPIPSAHQQQQQQASVKPKSDLDLPGEQMHYGGISYACSHTAQLQPHSGLNFHTNSVSGRGNTQVQEQHCAQQCMHNANESRYAQSAFDQWRPPVIVKVEKQQSVSSDPNNKNFTAEDLEKSRDIQFERRKFCKPKVNGSSPDSDVQTTSPRYVLHCLALTIN